MLKLVIAPTGSGQNQYNPIRSTCMTGQVRKKRIDEILLERGPLDLTP
jgi:hypothetical protein